MTEERILLDWTAFAEKLGSVGYEIFDTASVKVTEQGFADTKILALALLARTTSNLKGALVLIAENRIVEARTITRCVFENQFWVVGLVEEGDKFANRMLNDEMSRRKSRGELLFQHVELDNDVEIKLREFLKNTKKDFSNAKTLNPKEVASMGALANTYIFYGQLSSDSAHPSVDALNRYIVSRFEDDIGGIDVEPKAKIKEKIDTLDLLSLSVLGVYVAVNELLHGKGQGYDLTATADEYLELVKIHRELAS
jgi:hypothetical protein